MINEFRYYLENELARKASPDRGEAEALMGKAEGRLKFSIKARPINENTAAYIFEDIYECLREASQALMSLKGYKPYSHEALVSFLREFFSFPESDIVAFDRCRILRNKTIYRGEIVSAESCRESLNFLLAFLPKLKKEFDNLIK
jgi:uncharacterized protein (UPF0332 family)